jgi:hypothetical protein
MSGCDGGGNTTDSGTTAAASPTPGGQSPGVAATLPTTRKGVRVPAFPPQGTYADAKKILRIATDRAGVVSMIERHAARVPVRHADPKSAEKILALYDAGVPTAAASQPADTKPAAKAYQGAMVIQDHPADKTASKLYFLHNRGFVQVSANVTADAAKALGQPVTFDPPVQIWYWLDEVFVDEDEQQPEVVNHTTMMSASRLALGLRVIGGGAAPGTTQPVVTACAYFDGVTPAVLLDRVSLQNAQHLLRPLTRPAVPK